ncbi:hypothetical protein RvVAR0630_pl05310 (plasmid) [Agrobacterium vitis]|nr:hypothetical protein RvVAR0630_pl05310 [Agrobacterium vitis]
MDKIRLIEDVTSQDVYFIGVDRSNLARGLNAESMLGWIDCMIETSGHADRALQEQRVPWKGRAPHCV